MKTTTRLKSTLAALLLLGVILAAPAHAGTAASLDQLKSMVGKWEARTPDGKIHMTTTIRETANGTGIMETQVGSHGEMITVYTTDGDDLMLTHFCAVGNAPRMVARKVSGNGKIIEFALKDITNLAKRSDGHMNALKWETKDKDHFSQTWAWSENGKIDPKVFHFSRKK
jgi:hypothetical protein